MQEKIPVTMEATAQPLRARTLRRPAIKVEAFLANVPMFSEMSTQEIGRIAAGTHALRAEKGERIFHHGDPCTGFHIIVYGQVKLGFTSPQGGEKVIEIFGPGQSFGEATMFLDRPHIASAHALADVMLLHVAKNVVFDEFAGDPVFARKMMSGLALRLLALVSDVEAYSLRSSVERVIGYLLRDVAENPAACGPHRQVVILSTKGVLASRLSMTPEHFSRVLHDLSTVGLIEVKGKSVHIPDPERLRTHTV
jgi:CRP-like cAMP-binding protein